DKYGINLIGANTDAIRKAEDRDLFKSSMRKIGVDVPESEASSNVNESLEIAERIGYPVVVRPAYTLGGTGGGIAFNRKELEHVAQRGIELSMINQILIEKGVIGWKEFELEVMRDIANNAVIICSIENFDPMGIHTGDSITVAPAQTLTDMEYQRLRDASIDIIREIGVETGGSNIQFALHPHMDEMVAIEMNPRVSRSSALASKATGYPIAKIAAKLAVGYTLDEIPNDITKETPASFEPTIDYVVVKIPRFAFDKFPMVNSVLGSQMKSVGEVMAIGRTFEEALQKALRSLEMSRHGLGSDGKDKNPDREMVLQMLRTPNMDRVFHIRYALKIGFSVDEIYRETNIDPWFIRKIKKIVEIEEELKEKKNLKFDELDSELVMKAKRAGFSDKQLAYMFNTTEFWVREARKRIGKEAVFKMVDTCAAEFEAKTPYYYSSYEMENDAKRTDRKKVMILGSGPNRIGQGIEFDYCCVHSVLSLKDDGYETIMVNNNPETVSTDYDTSDRLYFEPITHEDVMNIYQNEKPEGVIVQFGGQTPLNISRELEASGCKVLGTSVDSIDIAEDRERFAELLRKLDIPQPDNGIAFNLEQARRFARDIGYPILVRPSYVLGGRAMEIIYDEKTLEWYINEAIDVSPDKPILIDKFLEDAIEIEVDALCDGEEVIIGGIMEHIEEAGVHSGDSACVLPPVSVSQKDIDVVADYTRRMALELDVKGLINLQFAIKEGNVYVLEANPRASRTVPFVSKASGIPLAKVAAKLMMGRKLKELGHKENLHLDHVAVKEAVFPFTKLPEVDPALGPEMKSTGEVMGIDYNFGVAYYKAELASGMKLPLGGRVFISVKKAHREKIFHVAKKMQELGFEITATDGTAAYLNENGVKSDVTLKISQGRPNIVDAIINKQVDLIINTPTGKRGKTEGYYLRRSAVDYAVPYITTIPGAIAAVKGIEAIKNAEMTIKSIQEYHESRK
ncbi:MAG: carbamoyl-phosphate synthase large subunit, partial [Archaeoglobaceae archaeon]